MFVRNNGATVGTYGVEVEDHTRLGYAGAGIAIVIWDEEHEGEMHRVDVSVEDWDRVVRHIGIGVEPKEEKPEPLADWELELLDYDSNPLPFVIRRNGEPYAAFAHQAEAEVYLSELPFKLGTTISFEKHPSMEVWAKNNKKTR